MALLTNREHDDKYYARQITINGKVVYKSHDEDLEEFIKEVEKLFKATKNVGKHGLRHR